MFLDAAAVMFHRNVFKDPAKYYLHETNDTVNRIEKFLAGEPAHILDIFEVYVVFTVSNII